MRCLAAVAALAVAAGACSRGQEADLLIRADRLFDGARVLEPGAVLIRGDDIVAVGAGLDADAAHTIELGDATILPGFIDLHVHTREPVLARGGVTTARDLGAERALLPPRRTWPLRVLAAGPIVTAPGGYPIPTGGQRIALEVGGEVRARAAVRDLARRGASVIKIALETGGGGPVLTADEVRAVVDEAHRHDLDVSGDQVP